MLLKIALPILMVLVLGGLLPIALSGCSRTATGNIETNPESTQPALPLLDTRPHGNLETAYFALG